MAIPQSNIQNFIQQSAGTQTTAQSAVPSAVNNGNPHTVYNTNPWQQQFNTLYPNQQAIPPMTTAEGQWFMPQNQQQYTPWAAPTGQTIQRSQIVWPDPVLPSNGNNWPGINPPPVTPPPTPPKGGNGGGGGPLGGNEPNTGSTGGEHGGNFNPGTPDWKNLLKNMGYDPGQPNSEGWNRAVQWTNAVNSRMAGAKNADGSWNWKQIADMITEPLIGGNLYLSGSDKWDVSNGIAGLVEAFTGIPVNALMNKLGEWQATQNDPADSWLEKMLVDHWEDNANNDLKVFGDTLSRYMSNYADFKVNNINNQNSNANQNWLNNYTNALTNAMLQGLKGQAASDYARQIANNQGRDTSTPGGGKEPNRPGGGGGLTDMGNGIYASDGGCVVVDNIIDGYERADDVRVDDLMSVSDPLTGNRFHARVQKSKTIMQPCVRLITRDGVILECSESAEISDLKGNRLQAVDLLGVHVPTLIDGALVPDVITSVEKIGELPVREIACENHWYLAGKEKGKYLFHHNVKYFNEYGNRTSGSGWQGSGSITPNGLMWGW